MTDQKDHRIEELERDLAEARRSAVQMMLSMVRVIAPTPEGREDVARGFDEAAVGDGEHARLAGMVADALRKEKGRN